MHTFYSIKVEFFGVNYFSSGKKRWTIFCFVWVSFRQEVEWAQISKNDMLRKKGLHFQFIVSDQTLTRCEYLKESAKEFLEQDHDIYPAGFRHMCRLYFTYAKCSIVQIHYTPHLPNWKQEKVCVLYHTFYYIVEDSFVKKLMACLCNVCIYITLYVVVRTYGQIHLLSWSKKH